MKTKRKPDKKDQPWIQVKMDIYPTCRTCKWLITMSKGWSYCEKSDDGMVTEDVLRNKRWYAFGCIHHGEKK